MATGKSRKRSKAETASRSGEAAFLRSYRAGEYPRPSVTVDIVIFTVFDTDLKVLLIKRKEHPHQGHWAIPGGFVKVRNDPEDQGEDLEQAALRELGEETGLPGKRVFLEQLYTFGDTFRDPRMRVITVAYYALLRPDLLPLVEAGSDAEKTRWFSVSHELSETALAFDHRRILDKAVERIRGKIDYAPIAFELVPPTFTIAQLRQVYEAIKGQSYDPGNFRRRFMRMQTDGIIERMPGKRQTASKPARVYRFVRQDERSPG